MKTTYKEKKTSKFDRELTIGNNSSYTGSSHSKSKIYYPTSSQHSSKQNSKECDFLNLNKTHNDNHQVLIKQETPNSNPLNESFLQNNFLRPVHQGQSSFPSNVYRNNCFIQNLLTAQQIPTKFPSLNPINIQYNGLNYTKNNNFTQTSMNSLYGYQNINPGVSNFTNIPKMGRILKIIIMFFMFLCLLITLYIILSLIFEHISKKVILFFYILYRNQRNEFISSIFI